MPAIEFRDVSYALPTGETILDRVTLAVDDGEIVALVGRSGSGKTTMLRLVNRLREPGAGEVIVGGRDVRQWDAIELRRAVGYVIQEVGLFPHLSVYDNVAVVPRLRRWDDTRVRDRVAELLDLVSLPTRVYGHRWPDELSGGQRQRVGVARALAGDPGILLMDEPFGALDPVTRMELQAEFRSIQQRLRKTVILVTHDMREALLLADRVAVLEDGALVACAPAARIAESPDPRVRRLLEAVSVPPPRERAAGDGVPRCG